MKYAWIDRQRTEYGLDEMCGVLDVSESGYRAWKRDGKPERKRTDSQMLALIHSIHVELKGAYGSPRTPAAFPKPDWAKPRLVHCHICCACHCAVSYRHPP